MHMAKPHVKQRNNNKSRHLLNTYSVPGGSKNFTWIDFLIFAVPHEGAIKNNLEAQSISGKL